jgi:hypothetical protein
MTLILMVILLLFGFVLLQGNPRMVAIDEITPAKVESSATPIPKVIYTFWDSHVVPPFIKTCITTWIDKNPDHTVIILNKQNVSKYLPDVDFESMKLKRIQHFADMVRIHILDSLGGIWIDASTIVTKPLTWVHERQAKNSAEYIGYNLKVVDSFEHSPMIENWFMACVPGSKFIRDWKNEFIKVNKYENYCTYIQDLKNEGIVFDDKYIECYLVMHAANQKILQQNKNAYKLDLTAAEDDAFKHLADRNWSILGGMLHLAYGKPVDVNIIKFRNPDREVFKYLIMRRNF